MLKSVLSFPEIDLNSDTGFPNEVISFHKLSRSGVSLTPGCIITSLAFQKFIDRAKAGKIFNETIDRSDLSNPLNLQSTSYKISSLIMSLNFDTSLLDEISSTITKHLNTPFSSQFKLKLDFLKSTVPKITIQTFLVSLQLQSPVSNTIELSNVIKGLWSQLFTPIQIRNLKRSQKNQEFLTLLVQKTHPQHQTVCVNTSLIQPSFPNLNKRQIIKVSQIAREIQKTLYFPQMCEFKISKKLIFLNRIQAFL